MLPTTKSSRRRGGPEGVVCDNETYVKLLYLVTKGMLPGDKIMSLTVPEFRKVFASALAALRLRLPFQPYSIRRGGATYHFRQHGNMTKVMEKGRWAESRTARIYVNTALAEMSQLVETSNVHAASFHFKASMHSALQRGMRGSSAVNRA